MSGALTVGGSTLQVHEAYSAWAARYDLDANRTRDLDQQITRRLLEHQRYGAIVELGCGTGKNTQLLARIGRQVIAFDFCDAMLRQARSKVSAAHVQFMQADLTQDWPGPASAADLVLVNLVLEHIEHLAPVFAQAAQRLAPGGALLVSELHPFRQYQGTQARFADAAGAQVLVPAFVHHLSDYLDAARAAGLELKQLREWWHADDAGLPPRLLSLEFAKP